MRYDLAITGSGGAAFAAAITAWDADASVVMIERGTVAGRDTRGVVKLVAKSGTGRVRGVHAVADGAGELITATSYAIRAQMTVTDLAEAWAPYLTVSERLRLAAQAFTRDVPGCRAARPNPAERKSHG